MDEVKQISVAVPAELLRALDLQAQQDMCSRSALIRQALRDFLAQKAAR